MIYNEAIYRESKYWERYALLTIRKMFYKNIFDRHGVLKDKPDIRIAYKNKSYGIEVVRLIKDKDAAEYSLINKYFGKRNNEEYIKKEFKKYHKNPKKIIVIDDTTMYLSDVIDIEDIISLFSKIMDKKIEKLDSYKLQDYNCLYVFAENYPISVEETIDVIKEKEGKYDYIFINKYDEIAQIKDNVIINKLELTNIDLKEIKNASKKYTANIIKNNAKKTQ